MAMIHQPITGCKHLRYGKRTLCFRQSVQEWLEHNIGIHGVDWHVKRQPNKSGEHDVVLQCTRHAALMFWLRWM